MNIEEAFEEFNFFNEGDYITRKMAEAKDIVLTAYEKEKEKNRKYLVNLTHEQYIKLVEQIRSEINEKWKDKIKPIQIIDLDGKIHNVYKIEEE